MICEDQILNFYSSNAIVGTRGGFREEISHSVAYGIKSVSRDVEEGEIKVVTFNTFKFVIDEDLWVKGDGPSEEIYPAKG